MNNKTCESCNHNNDCSMQHAAKLSGNSDRFFCNLHTGHIEDRICKTCSHWDEVEQNYDPRGYGTCSKNVHCSTSSLTVEDFGCNRYKEKE